MKKAILAAMGGLIAAALTACDGGTPGEREASASAKDGKTVVTISVLQADRLLRLAEHMYEQAHPDIDIQIKEYTATPGGESGQMNLAPESGTVEKYVNSVGTEILSGKGADLIELQRLPVAKYAEKKVLADLNELIAGDSSFDVNSYYGNILNPTRINGGLYAMPINFALKMMIGDKVSIDNSGVKLDDRAWSWDQFAELAKRLVKDSDGDGKPDKYAMTSSEPDSMLVNLTLDRYGEYVDAVNKQAHFDSQPFRQLLKQVKTLYDEGLVSGEPASWGEQYFSPWTANSLENLILYPQSVYDGNGSIYRKPGEGEGITFSSKMMLGINANSRVKKEAWDFLKFMLSDEIQSSPELGGLPLLRTVTDRTFDEIQQQLQSGSVKTVTGVAPQPLTEQELQSLKAMMEEAGAFTKSDPKIISILFEEAKSYFAGQKAAEEVARLIQNRVTTYLNE